MATDGIAAALDPDFLHLPAIRVESRAALHERPKAFQPG